MLLWKSLVFFSNWSIVDLQCFVNFCCTAVIQLYIYIYIHIIFYILFHYGLSQDTKYSSLCYTVGPCCLTILYVIICIWECINYMFNWIFIKIATHSHAVLGIIEIFCVLCPVSLDGIILQNHRIIGQLWYRHLYKRIWFRFSSITFICVHVLVLNSIQFYHL